MTGNAKAKKSLLSSPAARSVIASVICVIGGIAVGAVVLILLAVFSDTVTVGEAFDGIVYIICGPFRSGSLKSMMLNTGDMLLETAPLMMCGLSVALAFKTGLFNIGAPGQYLVGATASLLVALSMPTDVIPGWIVWIIAFLAGMLMGMIWGAVPGIFKAVFGINEVIVCIMMNWIAANAVSWLFKSTGDRYINVAETKSQFICPTSKNGVETLKLGLDKIFRGSNVDISIFIAVLFAIGVYIIIAKTTFGYELKACGFNKNAAKYAGMNEKKNIILSMVIAGGLAAAGASLWFLNGSNDFMWNTYSQLPATGFNGIPAALLASNNPIGTIFSSLFLRYIAKGGFNLSCYTPYNEYVSDLITAVIIYFAGFSKLIKDMLAEKNKKNLAEAEKKAAAGGHKLEEKKEGNA